MAQSAVGGPASQDIKSKMRKIATASVIGTTVEWYDLFVFATASALVFNKIFFPSFDALVGTCCLRHVCRRVRRPDRRRGAVRPLR